ncbi:MAG: metalloregulator ArsR/SmtB family transcription factor [Candidatus Latescibacteria bacterium]|nr:metalloregulator ArsR/SmtB family transcription factor [Candidatus Latescibacterota bacterium]NIM22020.1 metalloregulator ArsR/SmtB family transcription factor [Candidatus Latescibacterota bacterium]NIM66038.1 metalloregulator ArsR/SmtB family transcription factor [Candidatus Latescibacterota bacterium]NIO02446.1 metalloregulator ArsR/SmtB family transcription factor [Candidatus Latescibacterota bacterium]NIO29357.1 metalloregulator ArsR/SmtB family transcription factor [Candidatus Latesciba
MREFISISKALSDKNRVRLLLALRKGELCVCQLTELVQLAPSTVSKHLSILWQARLVETRKEGRWMLYKLPGGKAPREVREAISWTRRSLEGDMQIDEDTKRLDRLLKIDREELCSLQSRR